MVPRLALPIALACIAAGCGSPDSPEPEAKAPVTTRAFPVVIEIEGSPEDEAAVNSWIAKLREGFDARDYSPSPFLGPDDPYKGHIFWDADVWLFPALALIDPDRASKVPRTRLEWRIEYGADKLFWEVDERNNGVRVKVAELHRSHIGSAWWMLQRANALGMTPGDWRFDYDQFPVEASSYYKQHAVKTGRGWELKGVKSIDEYAERIDNDLYTNLVAQNVVGEPFHLPKDEVSYLTYDDDPLRSYQQAAAVLAIFPLQHPAAEAQAKVMVDRFAPKVNPRGPAMSDSIHATIYARIGETDKAYETWRISWRDYQRSTLPAKPNTPIDLDVFSEYRTQKRSYFLTGAAGCLNTVLYGFCGFRIDTKPLAGASWTRELDGGFWLSIKANLPNKWKRVSLPFEVKGKRFSLTATHDKVVVSER